jgi:zinc protease
VGNRILFGDGDAHGRPVDGYRKTVEAIGRADLLGFFADHWRPAGATLIVVGDFDSKQLRAQLAHSFGAWTAKAGGARPRKAAPAAAADKPAKLPRFVLIDRPGAPQTVLRVLGPGVPRRSPARAPLTLASTVLGGSFLSRLNANLREEKGYTYGAGGGFRFFRQRGSFEASADVFTKVTAPALDQLLKEVTGIASAPVRPDELVKARAINLARLAEDLATTGGTANVFAELATFGEPLDAPERFTRALERASAKAIAGTTAANLHPDDLAIIVVGDRSAIEAPLRALGLPAPQLRDPDGEPISAAP